MFTGPLLPDASGIAEFFFTFQEGVNSRFLGKKLTKLFRQTEHRCALAPT